MNCHCVRTVRAPVDSGWIKFVHTGRIEGGRLCTYASSRAWIDGSAEAIGQAAPDLLKAADCDRCKHKLICLVTPKCDRSFESK